MDNKNAINAVRLLKLTAFLQQLWIKKGGVEASSAVQMSTIVMLAENLKRVKAIQKCWSNPGQIIGQNT